MIDWIVNSKYMWGHKEEEKTMDDHKNKIEELEDKIWSQVRRGLEPDDRPMAIKDATVLEHIRLN